MAPTDTPNQNLHFNEIFSNVCSKQRRKHFSNSIQRLMHKLIMHGFLRSLAKSPLCRQMAKSDRHSEQVLSRFEISVEQAVNYNEQSGHLNHASL
jgi:hypothetical protein